MGLFFAYIESSSLTGLRYEISIDEVTISSAQPVLYYTMPDYWTLPYKFSAGSYPDILQSVNGFDVGVQSAELIQTA